MCFAEAHRYGLHHLLVDLIDVEVSFDDEDAFRFARGDGAVLIPDATVERILFLLEAAFIFAILSGDAVIAAARAAEAGIEGGKQEESQVRLQAAADEAVQVEDDLGTEFPAGTLVGLGGVGEAIADDNFSCDERGFDDFGDGLGAVGEHESHFRHGGEAGGAGIEQQLANAVAGGSAAGLARHEVGDAALLHPRRKALDLRGFAGPVESFEGDEEAALHGVSLS